MINKNPLGSFPGDILFTELVSVIYSKVQTMNWSAGINDSPDRRVFDWWRNVRIVLVGRVEIGIALSMTQGYPYPNDREGGVCGRKEFVLSSSVSCSLESSKEIIERVVALGYDLDVFDS
jgi:hypothetical protein